MSSTKKKLLATLAALAILAIAGGFGTYATFTSNTIVVPSNAFVAGSLSLTRSGSGAILSSALMKIGDDATGSITLTNTGTIDGDFTLAGSMTGDPLMGSSLQLAVYKDVDLTGTVVYTGSLSDFASASLGTFAAGASHTYYFHATLPTRGTDTLDNALQGLTATETFTWSGVQH